MRSFILRAVLQVTLLAMASAACADDRAIGAQAFEQACAACHGEPRRARAVAPTRADAAGKILEAQLSGLMALQASALNESRSVWSRCTSRYPGAW